MPSFDFAGRDSAGAVVRGRMDSRTGAGVRARLAARGLFITSIRERALARRRVPQEELTLFTQHLAMLLGAGLPLLQALETLAEQTEETRLRDVVSQAADDIQEGRTLSQALARHPELFAPVYIGVVRNGEVSGRLDDALARLGGYLDRDQEFRRKVRESLVYPAIVLGLAAIVMTVFLVYIIPAFDKVYRTVGAELPFPTRVLLAGSRLFRANVPLMLLAGASLIARPVRQAVWSRLARPLQALVMRVPHARHLAQTISLSRFVHALGAMLQSGVPVLPALEVAGQAAGSREFGAVVTFLQGQVSQGRRFHEAMAQTGRFPPMIVRIVAIGEESGRLDTMLQRAAVLMDREFELRMRRFLTFLEPVLTIFLGGVIGLVLLALYLPIFGLSSAITR
jgi:type IV pilus assembly protein PilC